MQIDSEGGAKRQYKGSFDCARQVFAKEGLVRGLYAGISAGIFRQLSYGMPRMAFYPMLLDRFKEPEGQTCALPPLTTDARHWSPRRANAHARRRMSFAKKLALGSIAGSTAALLGVPSEVCLVRMGADSKKCARPTARPRPPCSRPRSACCVGRPAAERRNYKHVVDAVTRIAREEGVAALWGGAGPTMARACLLNAGQLGVYSEAKEQIGAATGMTGLPLMFCGSLVSAVAAVGMSCPADVMKSRMQNAAPGQYAGMTDAAKVLIKNEGVLALCAPLPAPQSWQALRPDKRPRAAQLERLRASDGEARAALGDLVRHPRQPHPLVHGQGCHVGEQMHRVFQFRSAS